MSHPNKQDALDSSATKLSGYTAGADTGVGRLQKVAALKRQGAMANATKGVVGEGTAPVIRADKKARGGKVKDC